MTNKTFWAKTCQLFKRNYFLAESKKHFSRRFHPFFDVTPANNSLSAVSLRSQELRVRQNNNHFHNANIYRKLFYT